MRDVAAERVIFNERMKKRLSSTRTFFQSISCHADNANVRAPDPVSAVLWGDAFVHLVILYI